MPNNSLGANQVKIQQLIFGGLFILIVLMGVRSLMVGQSGNIKMLVAGSIAVAAVLALDKYYWILCPAFICSNLTIPGVPFTGANIGCMLLIVVYFIRQTMHKEHAIKLDRHILVALPVFLWIAMVWMLNPTGLAALGSSSIGGRFYFEIVLGFITLLVLSSFSFSERDCKVLFWTILIASIFSYIQSQVNARVYAFDEGIALDEQNGRYYLLGALTLYILMFSRYRPSEILGSIWKTGLVLLFAVLVVVSGKRRGLGSLLFIPVLKSYFIGRDKLLIAISSVVVCVILGVVVSGDGSLWELPSSAKRSLSVLFPKYTSSSSAMGMTDLFRDEMRLRGREVIRRSPWFGRKGFAMDRSDTSWILYGASRKDQYASHVYSGNWHSTWYAFACDFGLPAMIFWAFYLVCILRWIFLGFRRKAFGEFPMSVYSYYAILIFLDAIFSYTSGQSGVTSSTTWINWGFVLAILNGRPDRDLSMKMGGVNK